MRRAIRILDLVGLPLLAFGLVNLDLRVVFACETCPDADRSTIVLERLAQDIPLALLCALPVTAAWILCLVQLVRLKRQEVAAALTFALPLIAALSLWLFYANTGGTWRFETMARIPAEQLLGVTLLWPVATFAATFALKRGQDTE